MASVNTDAKELVVNGQTYIKKDKNEKLNGDIKIAILQRGWVMVGKFKKVGTQCFLEDASVIRVWGTTNGLGEIALNGPTKTTKLDACGTVEFHELTIVALLSCNSAKWE